MGNVFKDGNDFAPSWQAMAAVGRWRSIHSLEEATEREPLLLPFTRVSSPPLPPPPPLPLRGIVDFGERPKSGGASYRFLEYLIFETEPLENN